MSNQAKQCSDQSDCYPKDADLHSLKCGSCGSAAVAHAIPTVLTQPQPAPRPELLEAWYQPSL